MKRWLLGTIELRRELTLVPEVIHAGVRSSAMTAAHVVVDVPSDLPPVDVDVVLMEQVLANLLDNAARHSPEATPVVVSARARGDAVELAVTDRGPGVPAGERERVFTMFSHLGQQGRAGLGLAIAKAFVEAHGQTIHVEDAPKGGARFVVTLPAATVPADL